MAEKSKRRCTNCGKAKDAKSGIVVANRLGLQGLWCCSNCANEHNLLPKMPKLSTDPGRH
jgi:hypothetical protein